MATLRIQEYGGLRHHFHPMQVPSTPPTTVQTPITIGVASVQSAAFAAGVNLVEVSTDAICSVAVGGTNPTATTNNTRLPADTIIYFGVRPGEKLAVITNT